MPPFFFGLLAGVLSGGAAYLLGRSAQPGSGLLLLAFAVGAPLAACILAVLVFDPKGDRSTGSHAGLGFVVILAMLLGSMVFLHEGVICVFMALPIFMPIGVLGAVATGKLARRSAGRALCMGVLAIPFVALPLEPADRQPAFIGAVTTSVEVDAPPEEVWRRAVEIRHIRRDELGWTITQDVLRVPKPLDARLEGRGVGAVRHAYWRRAVYFREHIVEWDEGRRLGWTFELPVRTKDLLLDDHLEIGSEYLSLLSGSYTLVPLPSGRTRLVLQTRYRARTPFNSYAAAWGRLVLGDFHRNVLRVVKARSEAAALS
jgi:hypothetical protein